MSPSASILSIAIVSFVLLRQFRKSKRDSAYFGACGQGRFAKNLHVMSAFWIFAHVPRMTPVDVRSSRRFREKHLPGAVNAPFVDGELDVSALGKLDPSQPILVYSEKGLQSRGAIPAILSEGFVSVFHINRGIRVWRLFGGDCEYPDE